MGFSSPYIIIAKILLSYREKRGCARLAIPCISSLDFHHEALAGLITHTFHPTLQHLFCDLPFSDSEPVSRLLRESSSISYTRISSLHDRVDYWLFLGLHITPIDTSLRFRHFIQVTLYCSTDMYSGLYCTMVCAIYYFQELHPSSSITTLMRPPVRKYPFS